MVASANPFARIKLVRVTSAVTRRRGEEVLIYSFSLRRLQNRHAPPTLHCTHEDATKDDQQSDGREVAAWYVSYLSFHHSFVRWFLIPSYV